MMFSLYPPSPRPFTPFSPYSTAFPVGSRMTPTNPIVPRPDLLLPLSLRLEEPSGQVEPIMQISQQRLNSPSRQMREVHIRR